MNTSADASASSSLPHRLLAGIRGPADTTAGAAGAGAAALRMGLLAVAEGRCPAALVVLADSLVSAEVVRDRARMGLNESVGEAGVALLLLPAAEAVFAEAEAARAS